MSSLKISAAVPSGEVRLWYYCAVKKLRLWLPVLCVAVGSIGPGFGVARADDDHGRPVDAVAKDLGVTPDKFRTCFKSVSPAPKGERPKPGQREQNRKVLSECLGVSPEALDTVMDKHRPEGPRH